MAGNWEAAPVIGKARVNQTNSITRKNTWQLEETRGTSQAVEPTVKKVQIVSMSGVHDLLLFNKAIQQMITDKLKISTNMHHFISFTCSQQERI